jgi:formate-dependent nitrite reductase cytochrome c552 subunit
MGYNAYFVGSVSPTSSQYRSPHSLITGACVNCHMEQTPPPALLSYNLAGTNHSFKPSITICSNCHSVNQSLGPMLQAKVKSTLEVLEASIEAKIVSRSTDTRVLVSATLTESSGQPAVIGVFSSPTTTTITVQLNNLLGVRISDLGTDALAKAVWNFMLIEGDASEGVHNPDFTLAVLGAAQKAVDDIPNALVPSNEL